MSIKINNSMQTRSKKEKKEIKNQFVIKMLREVTGYLLSLNDAKAYDQIFTLVEIESLVSENDHKHELEIHINPSENMQRVVCKTCGEVLGFCEWI